MTDWTVNRRWDNCVWQSGRRWHMLCLAADYSQPGNKGKLWWQGDNAIERWSGPDLQHLELEATARRTGTIWTAPSVFPWRHDVIAMAGLNRDGKIPDQEICYLDPYSLEIERGRSVPPPPKTKQHMGCTAWRDPSLCQWGNRYLLTVTSGGFRWGNQPNVFGYLSDDPRGPWEPIGPLVDPAWTVLFAELERPQVHQLTDGRFVLFASCWPARQFVGRKVQPLHVFVSAWDEPVFSRYLGSIDVENRYGMGLFSGHWCGWAWTDSDTASSEVHIIHTATNLEQMVEAMTAARSQEQAIFDVRD